MATMILHSRYTGINSDLATLAVTSFTHVASMKTATRNSVKHSMRKIEFTWVESIRSNSSRREYALMLNMWQLPRESDMLGKSDQNPSLAQNSQAATKTMYDRLRHQG